ncbi:DUF6950 family protein [Novosphingobium sp.]|jgi:hypothetical protein|uniref:DUF6950 family protein n=1 Tax=Novosphingobium sp. TaxID=1874826 RepID=UPI002FDFABC3
MDLLERVTKTQTTIDQFLNKDFAWGEFDCAALAATHVENLGFETVRSKARKYSTEIGAKRALHKLGYSSMEDLVDSYGFERIPPAMAITGDIVGFPGGTDDHQWTGLGVMIDPGQHLIAFANGRCMVGPTSVCTVAWRVS